MCWLFSSKVAICVVEKVRLYERQTGIVRDGMMGERTFVLGVGAQKAGTTWLHSYVASSANASMGFTKEYHIWDAVCSPLCKNYKLQKSQLSKLNTSNYLRYCMQEIPGFYEGFFNSLFNSGAKITGDITPSYSVLTEADFHKIKNKIKLTGAKVRCVFLMRDPVERCWSAVRMALRNQNKSDDEEQLLAQLYSDEKFQFRTRYEVVCERLRNVFEEEELYFGFYETMFDDGELERISNFLSIPANYEHRNKHVNVSPKGSQISIDLRQKIQSFYSKTYDYCFENFEETKQIWR